MDSARGKNLLKRVFRKKRKTYSFEFPSDMIVLTEKDGVHSGQSGLFAGSIISGHKTLSRLGFALVVLGRGGHQVLASAMGR